MDSAQLEIGTSVGDILLGKYRVDRVLGVGGMGAVVAAHHLKLDQTVAIKVLLPDVLEDEEVVSRFEREARASARIKSDHIARVNDVGTLDNGTPYMVMEYLEGEDLDALLRQGKTFPIEQALDFLIQTCEVLSEAHALGIVHRDLKPANLFCVERPGRRRSVKVLDFGISKVMTEELTTVRGFLGSPAYMSPEQIREANSVDARADLWAAGVVLFELLTGRTPFGGRTLPAVLTNIAIQPTPSVRLIRPDVPIGLEVVIQKCLEKDPDDRYQSADELAKDLALFLPRKTVARPERPARRTWVDRGGAWLGAAGVTLIILAGVLGLLHLAAATDASSSPDVARPTQAYHAPAPSPATSISDDQAGPGQTMMSIESPLLS
jgi:serine/threonine-protein kinase